jgi:hypothetical protein
MKVGDLDLETHARLYEIISLLDSLPCFSKFHCAVFGCGARHSTWGHYADKPKLPVGRPRKVARQHNPYDFCKKCRMFGHIKSECVAAVDKENAPSSSQVG